jgi:NAD(P)-dependent dehydrogenase (short-subunit alcohol dehydrogenase family)
MPIAIITGGNSGIGKAAAVALAERGHDVGVTWHAHEDTLEEVLSEIRSHGVRAAAARMDLDTADPRELPSRARAVEELFDGLGGVDVFVANVGGGLMAPFLEYDLETWLRTLSLNLTGTFVNLQQAAKRLVAQGRGGRIIAVTSVHEHAPLSDSSAYVASKHGVGGLVKQMAMELAHHGITVNAVAPGEIATRMTGQEDEDPEQAKRRGIPAGRPGAAREVASAIAWLAEPDARYCTGHSLVVDGGMLLMGPMANQLAGG